MPPARRRRGAAAALQAAEAAAALAAQQQQQQQQLAPHRHGGSGRTIVCGGGGGGRIHADGAPRGLAGEPPSRRPDVSRRTWRRVPPLVGVARGRPRAPPPSLAGSSRRCSRTLGVTCPRVRSGGGRAAARRAVRSWTRLVAGTRRARGLPIRPAADGGVAAPPLPRSRRALLAALQFGGAALGDGLAVVVVDGLVDAADGAAARLARRRLWGVRVGRVGGAALDARAARGGASIPRPAGLDATFSPDPTMDDQWQSLLRCLTAAAARGAAVGGVRGGGRGGGRGRGGRGT